MRQTILQRRWYICAFLGLLLAAAGCSEPASTAEDQGVAAESSTALITGTLSYRERVALTDRAEVQVTLEDVSRQDVAATVLARQTISDPGQVPIRFELQYDPAEIDPGMSYAVRARIHDRGRLLFISDTHTPVLTRGAGREAHLRLVQVPPAAPASRAEDAPDEPGMELEGMFRYMADAALFRDCRTGKSYPVAMESAYIELERAYLNSGIEGGSEILVRLRGRYLERPSMEGNNNKISLIVDKLEEIDPEKTCAPTVHAELQNTYWKLIELDGKPVQTLEGMREAHLILTGDGTQARGHAGCNNFFGSFFVKEDTLTFSALGSTMKACPEGMDTEQAFLDALGQTNRHAIIGQFLTLYADDAPLARFEAVYL